MTDEEQYDCELDWDDVEDRSFEQDDLEEQADPAHILSYRFPDAMAGAAHIRALAAQPIEWAWQDFGVVGTIVTLAGKPVGGKTTLLFLLLLARANTGEPIEICGRPVIPAPAKRYVILIEGEHGEKSAARKLVKSANLLGLGDAALDRVVTFARKDLALDSPVWDNIRAVVKQGLVSDIAIDTIARCAPKGSDANSETDQIEIFHQLALLIETAPADAQPTVWVVAHTRKEGTEPKRSSFAAELDEVSGSAQRVGQSDSVIMVAGERDKHTSQIIASHITLLKAREEPERFPERCKMVIANGTVKYEMNTPRDLVALVKEYGQLTPGECAEIIKDTPANVKRLFEEHERAGNLQSIKLRNGDRAWAAR